MSRRPRDLLAALARDAARQVLDTPGYAGQDIDPDEFAALNPRAILLVIARAPGLRARLAEAYAAELADGPDLLRDLVAADPARAEQAATALGADPGRLAERPSRRAARRAARTARPDAGDKAAARAARNLAEARAARDRAKGQLAYVITERDTARAELSAALTDRDDALATIAALRAELAAVRQQHAALAGDVQHAAEVIAAAVRPPDQATDATVDVDPREREHRPTPEPPQDGAAPAAVTDPLISAALAAAGVTAAQLLQVLDTVRHPPAPEPRGTAVVLADRQLTVTPLGGGTEIGGSCVLVEVGDVRILVDAGMRPKQPLDQAGPPGIQLARAGHLNAVVITHAHHDHAGYLPALVADHPHLDVFCTADTAALLPTMWADSVKVFTRSRHEHLSRGEPAPDPPYTQPHALAAQRRIRELAYGRVVEVADGVTVELFPAGHILGAAGVVVTAGPRRVTVTGDVCDLAQATTPGLVLPDAARDSDLLVIESTHCQPTGTRRPAEVENFVATVAETIASGGRVLVPAFALGRAQEVALTLRERLPDVPVLIDGMAKEITRIYEKQTAAGDNPLRIYGANVREVPVDERRELITSFRRGVIVTTSGMLTAGPAVQWARSILPDPTAALLVAGYQDAESPGAALLALADEAGASFELDGQRVDVNARVAKFGLSAHADRTGLTSIINRVNADAVMLVHGMPRPQREFADHLRRLGHHVTRTDRWQP
ncbi:MBL fold metallo-hydrolase RNA specificity domain-containing protein [Goodfellowiella coeruleoviolacea]|uniref:RNA processing exonuclease, beta-lactamase fold, Cft2 family n=1 Tax=Goodfellowiella coeruleoviolacea TaxID=334858 RepID=A0AAE3GKS5_9PSEU|nr:MBL fold metallo-hydrolase [Goodfellowiella coeruleoviolacea]MCP2170041.1 RNA processing exonuclease, beta-lactamase fold, Cft2 family [Goodfellowiella coeruleoviolacea]